jgi:hypothetical protein
MVVIARTKLRRIALFSGNGANGAAEPVACAVHCSSIIISVLLRKFLTH